jgi:hypothetical protein
MRRLFVLAMLVGGLLLATTGAGSAQTTDFNAKVLGHITRPSGGAREAPTCAGRQPTRDSVPPSTSSL